MSSTSWWSASGKAPSCSVARPTSANGSRGKESRMNEPAKVRVAHVDARPPRQAALYCLALGTFAIGTEGFMIAAILPNIAADLAVSVALAGSLISIFALAYALSSPILTALTGRVDRRKLLLAAMTIFSLANVVAASTHTFWGLAAARVGLLAGLPARAGAGMVTATLRERVRVMRQPSVAPTLLVTTAWAVGTYTVYSFIASFLATATPLRGPQVGYALFLWGASAGVGVIIGGNATDKLGARAVIRTSLSVLALALAGLSTVAHVLPPTIALPPVLLAMIAWGLCHWGFFPAQQTGLIQIVGLKLAPIVLSLNASFMYLGFSLGAAVGGFTLLHATVTDLGWVGAAFELAALTLFLKTRAAARAQGTPADARTSPCAST